MQQVQGRLAGGPQGATIHRHDRPTSIEDRAGQVPRCGCVLLRYAQHHLATKAVACIHITESSVHVAVLLGRTQAQGAEAHREA